MVSIISDLIEDSRFPDFSLNLMFWDKHCLDSLKSDFTCVEEQKVPQKINELNWGCERVKDTTASTTTTNDNNHHNKSYQERVCTHLQVCAVLSVNILDGLIRLQRCSWLNSDFSLLPSTTIVIPAHTLHHQTD